MTPHIHVRLGAVGEGSENADWLKLIWEINGKEHLFGAPELGEWWAGGTVEEYPDARVIHRGDGTVSVVGKTERGDAAIAAAAEVLGFQAHPTITYLVAS